MTDYTLLKVSQASEEDGRGIRHAIHITFAKPSSVRRIDATTLEINAQDLEKMSFTFWSGMPLSEFADFLIAAATPFSSQEKPKGST